MPICSKIIHYQSYHCFFQHPLSWILVFFQPPPTRLVQAMSVGNLRVLFCKTDIETTYGVAFAVLFSEKPNRVTFLFIIVYSQPEYEGQAGKSPQKFPQRS